MNENSIFKFAVIIPAYKPREQIIFLIDSIVGEGSVDSVICVNDGSGKEYAEIFGLIEKKEKCRVISHEINQGKGRALKTGFEYIIKTMPFIDAIVTVDADGQHTIGSIQRVIKAFEGRRELILGSRDLFQDRIGEDGVRIPLRSRFGNACTRIVFRYLCDIKLSDTQTGLRVYPVSVLRDMLTVKGEKYEYETNVLLYCKQNDILMCEVPIETIYEDKNPSSHFRPIIDSILIYMEIIKYAFSSLLSVVIDNAIFWGLSYFMRNIYIMTYIGRAVAAVANFTVNRKAVFKSTEPLPKQVVMYTILLILSGTVSATAVKFLSCFFDRNTVVIKLFVEGVLFFFNFYIQKYFVFKKGKKETVLRYE